MSDMTLRMLLQGRDESASKALKGVGSEAERTRGHFASLGHIAAGVFGGQVLMEGARKGVEFLKSSVEAAVDDEASQRKLALALKNTTGATKEQTDGVSEWLTKQSEAFGVSKDDLMPAFQRLAESSGSVTKAQKEMKIAMDVSAGTGKNLATVSSALMKANNGTTSSLGRLGLKTKDAQGNTLSLKDALKTMADTFHGQAEARAKSLQGEMDRLHATFHEMEVHLGQKLIPVLLALGQWFFTKGLPAFQAVAGFVGGQLREAFDAVRPVLEQLKAGFENLLPAFGAVGDFIRKNPGTMKVFVVALLAIVGAILLVTAATAAWTAVMDMNPIGLLVVALAALAAGLYYAYTHSQKFRAIVKGSLDATRAVASAFIGFFRGAWQKWGNDILSIGRAVFAAVKGVIGGDLKIIEGLIKVFSGIIHGNWSQVWQGVKMIVSGAWQVIRSEVKLGALAVVALVKAVPGMLANLGSLFAAAGKGLIHALFSGIIGAARAGMGFISDLVGAIKNSINSALHLPLQVNFDKGPIHIHATVIPALAKGGIVSRPTLAMIGEAGPEAVVPLSGRGGGLGGLGGRGDIHIIVNANGLVDPQTMVRRIHSEMLKLRVQGFGGRAMGFD